MTGSILILDDEPKMGRILQRILKREGYEVEFTVDPRDALELLSRQPFHILVTDLKMPTMTGIEVLEQAKALRPECDVIMMTAFASAETAVESMKKGAYDYLIKPFANEELKILIRRALETKILKEENRQLKAALSGQESEKEIVAVSKAMREALARARKIAVSEAAVLLQGASGTGKEVLAEFIHRHSPRAAMPLVKVNCGALPESLLESELFGHARGAFTGAIASRKGLFEAADGGTIFLDEIGEVTQAFQVKLLRILQNGEFQRVGESDTRRADVRVIAATNRSLEQAIEDGSFRSDLYFRLNVAPIHIPPLEDRPEDIVALIEHFLLRHSARQKARNADSAGAGASPRAPSFSTAAIDLMMAYHWPGNVRELENAIEHALVMAEGEILEVADLPLTLQNYHAKRQGEQEPVLLDQMTLEEIERRCILNALRRADYNYTRAAKLLGVTRRTLGYRMQKHGLENPKREDGAEAEDMEGDGGEEPEPGRED